MGRNACAIIHGHVAAARAPSGRHGGGTSSRPSPIQPVLSCFWPWTRPIRRELYRTQPPACPVPRRVDQRHLLRQRWRRCSTAPDRTHGIAEWPLLLHLHSSAGFSKCHCCHRAHTARHGAATLTPPPRPWAWEPPPAATAPSQRLFRPHTGCICHFLSRDLATSPGFRSARPARTRLRPVPPGSRLRTTPGTCPDMPAPPRPVHDQLGINKDLLSLLGTRYDTYMCHRAGKDK